MAEDDGLRKRRDGSAAKDREPDRAKRQKERAEEARTERPWDIAHDRRKAGVDLMLWVFVAVGWYFTVGVMGTITLLSGYATSKASVAVFGGKVADCFVFRSGYRFFLWTLGVLPTVQVMAEPENGDKRLDFKAARRSLCTTRQEISQTPIIVSNHVSYLDGPVLALLLGVPRIVAMIGSLKVPIFGPLVKEIESIVVDRSDPESRKATLYAMEEHCKTWRKGDRPLLIFPEGTVSNGEGVITFKRGAFVPGAPVRPVLLVYTGPWTPAATTYWESSSGKLVQDTVWSWFLQVSCHLVKPLRVIVLPPYLPSAEEKRDPDLYAANVQAYMGEQLAAARAQLRPERARHKEQ